MGDPVGETLCRPQKGVKRAAGVMEKLPQIGRLEQARIELSVAIELFSAMEMTFWLPRAEPELAKASGR